MFANIKTLCTKFKIRGSFEQLVVPGQNLVLANRTLKASRIRMLDQLKNNKIYSFIRKEKFPSLMSPFYLL